METNENIQEKKNILKKIGIKIPPKIKIIILLIIMVAVFLLGITYSKVSKHEETVLEYGFKDIGELSTQEWYGRIIEDSTNDRKAFKKISIPFTKSRIIFSLDVEVKAGIDFSEIEYDISNSQNKITITLPKSKIFSYSQVPHTFKTYLDDESWFNNIDSTERHNLEDAVVEKGKKEALDSGILEKADKNAKVMIEQMIRTKNKNIKIVWKEK